MADNLNKLQCVHYTMGLAHFFFFSFAFLKFNYVKCVNVEKVGSDNNIVTWQTWHGASRYAYFAKYYSHATLHGDGPRTPDKYYDQNKDDVSGSTCNIHMAHHTFLCLQIFTPKD
jgi:hypothetical protein